MRQLDGRTGLVTGASRGLGRRIARELALEGMNLVLAARTAEALEDAAEELRGEGARAVVVTADLARREDVEALTERAEEALGGVDLLVNNAGIMSPAFHHRRSPEEIEGAVQVNLVAPMVLARLLLPGMLERGRGHVVNLSSLAGKSGPPFETVYGATKAGLIGFTQSLRRELRGSGVGASVICPGYVSGPGMYEDAVEETGVEAPPWIGRTTPEAVARAVVRAVRRDLPEVIVNSVPVRPLLALSELSPSLGDRVARALDMFRPIAAPFRGSDEGGAR